MGKNILKILIGFLAANAVFNFYFAVSGNFPPPFYPGGSQLNFGMSWAATLIDLAVVAGLLYFVFLKKGTGRVSLKDFSVILVGAFAHLVLDRAPEADYLMAGIYLLLFLVFVYLGLCKK